MYSWSSPYKVVALNNFSMLKNANNMPLGYLLNVCSIMSFEPSTKHDCLIM